MVKPDWQQVNPLDRITCSGEVSSVHKDPDGNLIVTIRAATLEKHTPRPRKTAWFYVATTSSTYRVPFQ